MTATPHAIRLRDPWQLQTLDSGQIRCGRRFGRPTGLGPDDRVELVVGKLESHGVIALNGQRLGEVAPRQSSWRADVTSRLLPRNELVITLECCDDALDQDNGLHKTRPEEPPDASSPAPRPRKPDAFDVRLEIHPAPRPH